MNRRYFIASAAAALGMTASAFADGSTTILFETFKPYFVLNTIKPEKGKKPFVQLITWLPLRSCKKRPLQRVTSSLASGLYLINL